MIAEPSVKINLGIDVLRKRPDGYHDIETLFVPYHELHDTLEIVKADDYPRTLSALMSRYSPSSGQIAQAVSEDAKVMITIARKEGVDWSPLDDLTVKAYMEMAKDHDLGPVKIYLEKKSPVGAGLGGGSSDAASAIDIIDSIFGLGLSLGEKSACAARTGSDCAFFLHDRPMFGSGRGEVLEEYDLPEGFDDEYEIKVLVPEGISVSTADAYRGIVPQVPEIPLASRLALPVEQWRDSVKNAFEDTVFRKYPALAGIKQSLYDSGAVYASMSGSGSALFAIYRKD